MPIDALAFEPHFLDHLAPVWQALPATMRGTLTVAPDLVERAAACGLAAESLPLPEARRGSPPPAAPGGGPIALVASIGDTKIGRRLGYRRFVRLEHGMGQAYPVSRFPRHPSYPGGEDNEDAALFLVPNDYAAARWRTYYPATPVAIVGSPRLDRLPAREPGPFTVAITFHWQLNLCPETQPAAEFIPALVRLGRGVRLLGHLHPRWQAAGDHLAKYYERAGIEIVRDFDDVCRRADVLIFDNTSAGYEFAATRRPVVVMNSPGYRKQVEQGLRFWSAATVGEQVTATHEIAGNARNLAAAIDRAVASDGADRDAALEQVYAYRHGAAQRAADAISEWADQVPEVAA